MFKTKEGNMPNHIDLEFNAPKESDIPGPARAYIRLTSYCERTTGRRGPIKYLGSECVTENELVHCVNSLKKELDNALIKGRRLFAKQK